MSHSPDEDGLIFWIVAVGSLVGISLPTLLLLWTGCWKEKVIDAWASYRLRVARHLRRADYIRWWRSR